LASQGNSAPPSRQSPNSAIIKFDTLLSRAGPPGVSTANASHHHRTGRHLPRPGRGARLILLLACNAFGSTNSQCRAKAHAAATSDLGALVPPWFAARPSCEPLTGEAPHAPRRRSSPSWPASLLTCRKLTYRKQSSPGPGAKEQKSLRRHQSDAFPRVSGKKRERPGNRGADRAK
jgi:hypothetical protein